MRLWVAAGLLAGIFALHRAGAQLASRTGNEVPQKAAPHRTRLILKDGSYQIILGYKVVGAKVQYVSAERAGETEEIPLAMVDLDATKKWDLAHQPADPNAPPVPRAAPALDPELLKEEAERASFSPEVAPDLRLAPEDSVLAMDNFHAVPELVILTQTDGELNKQTGHNILRSKVNPAAAPHQIIVLKGERSTVQMHVNDPVIYVKTDDELPGGGNALTVDTHGASSQNRDRKENSDTDYVIVRLDVRQDARVVASVNIAQLGTGKRQEDVIETEATLVPGGHWVKIVPKETLLVGEYALLEVLDGKSINLGVWDFGVHPTAPENRDVLKPERRRPASLERRTQP